MHDMAYVVRDKGPVQWDVETAMKSICDWACNRSHRRKCHVITLCKSRRHRSVGMQRLVVDYIQLLAQHMRMNPRLEFLEMRISEDMFKAPQRFTRGCGGCSSWFRGLGRQPHTEGCRRMFEGLLKETAKYKNWVERKRVYEDWLTS